MSIEELDFKKLELEFRKEEFNKKHVIEREELTMAKIDLLQDLLVSSKPDATTAFGSETKYLPIISERNAEIIEKQIMELIKKIC